MKQCWFLKWSLCFVATALSGPSHVEGPESIPNPISGAKIKEIQSVIIASWGDDGMSKAIETSEELDAVKSKREWEIKIVEVIKDPYRVAKLKNVLATSELRKKRGFVGASYELLFLDDNGNIVAAASYFLAPKVGYVLNLTPNAFKQNGRYYYGWGTERLGGNWQSAIDYRHYAIPFSAWQEAIGYTPGW